MTGKTNTIAPNPPGERPASHVRSESSVSDQQFADVLGASGE